MKKIFILCIIICIPYFSFSEEVKKILNSPFLFWPIMQWDIDHLNDKNVLNYFDSFDAVSQISLDEKEKKYYIIIESINKDSFILSKEFISKKYNNHLCFDFYSYNEVNFGVVYGNYLTLVSPKELFIYKINIKSGQLTIGDLVKTIKISLMKEIQSNIKQQIIINNESRGKEGWFFIEVGIYGQCFDSIGIPTEIKDDKFGIYVPKGCKIKFGNFRWVGSK